MNSTIKAGELINSFTSYQLKKEKIKGDFYIDENNKNQCQKLIKSAENIIKEIYKLDIKMRPFLYFISSYIYIDIMKFELIKYGYIKDEIWTQPLLTNDLDNKMIEENIKKEIDILEYIKENNLLFEKNEVEKTDYNTIQKYDRYSIISQLRSGYQFIANIYYFVFNNMDLFLENSILAVGYNSISSASLLVRYFCDNDEYGKAYYYLKKCIDIEIEDKEAKYNKIKQEMSKIMCYSYVYHYLYNNSSYDEARKIIGEEELFIEKLKYTKDLKDELKKINKAFINKCNNKIEEKQKIKINVVLLKKYFSEDIIDIMSDDIKIYIATSLRIFDYISTTSNTMDYSASLIPIMKGVESILFEIIVMNYLPFLKSKNNLDFSLVNKPLKMKNKVNNKDELVEKLESLEMGSVLYNIAKKSYSDNNEKNDFIANQYFLDFCLEKNVKSPQNTINEFASDLNNLKDKRNKVAHKNRVLKSDADEDLKFLLEEEIKFIEFLYINFRFCFKKKN